MELRISSTENIKPSPPTPDNLRTHKLSFIDQLNPGAYFSIILFYSAGASSERLKKSLSETLTHFYPFAGQSKDNLVIDCDDHGVTFIEAYLAEGDMSEVIQQAKTNILEQLIPCKPHESTTVEHNLIVQVNYFGCGGMAIGVCFHHKVADAATAANFLKTWGLHARGAGATNDFKHVIYDSNSIFPAQDLPHMSVNLGLGLFSLDSVVKRFTFEGEKIASLREKIVKAEPCLDRPSRVEVVSSVILGALLAAYGGLRDDDEYTTTLTNVTNVTVIIAVNLRKRMNPPLPEQSFGNICSAAFLNLPIDRDHHDHEKKINHSSLAGQLHQSIRMVDDQLVRKLYVEGEIMNILNAAQGLPKSNKVFVISSWCKMPFHEADFGWGKPISIGVGARITEAAVLVDSCETEGIEAWVGLSKQVMARFQQHPGILAYASP